MYRCLVHHLRNDVPVAKNIYFFYTKKQVCFHIFAKLLSRSYRKNTILYYLWFIIIVYYHLLKEFYFMKLNEIEITDFNAPELDIYARCATRPSFSTILNRLPAFLLLKAPR